MTSHPLLITSSLALMFACQPAEPVLDDVDSRSITQTNDTGPQSEDQNPVAHIDAPSSGYAWTALTLDGSASTAPEGEEITAYDWSCSDGSTGTESTLTVTFSTEGDVDCDLTVTATEGGQDSDQTTISILNDDKASWTFMVFVNGDNNLEDAALDDMNEMERVGSSASVNIVVQIDRSTGQSSADGNWSGARRYLAEKDNDTDRISSPVLDDLGAVDSGDADSVVDFVAWAAETYPAEHYALILWDHGWGWSLTESDEPRLTKGISSDDSTGSDISVAEGELEQLLEDSSDILGQRLDLLGMDACLMQAWEIAYVSSAYADILVASQDYEDYDGWPYDGFLADLVADPEMTAADLGESIANNFHQSGDSTQSVVDLAALSELNAALDDIATILLESSDGSRVYRQSANGALAFEYSSAPDHDLGDLLTRLLSKSDDEDVLNAVSNGQDILESVVLSNYSQWTEEATGLNIYSPSHGQIDPAYLGTTWAENTLWDDLISDALSGRDG